VYPDSRQHLADIVCRMGHKAHGAVSDDERKAAT
jgi:hypothetical protein